MEEVVQAVDKKDDRSSVAAGSAPAAGQRVITFRALLCAFVISTVAALMCHWHDGHILASSTFVVIRNSSTLHNYFAPLAVGLIFFFLLMVNALLFRIHRRLALRTGELALVVSLSLLAAPIPRYLVHPQLGIVGYTPIMVGERRAIVMDMVKANPYAFLEGGVKKADSAAIKSYLGSLSYPASRSDLLEAAQRNGAPDDVKQSLKRFSERTYTSVQDVGSEVESLGYFRSPLDPGHAFLSLEESRQFDGVLPGHTSGWVSLWKIPWGVWLRPALFWAPLVLPFLIFSITLGYMLYRQWAHRELLPFPLAEFAASLVVRRPDRALPDVFYSPLFWVGLVAMVLIFSAAGLANFLDNMIYVRTKFNYMVLATKISFLNDSREGYSLLRGTIYFAIVAVAYLLPSEISLTAWVSWPLMVIATFLFYNQTGNRFNEGHNTMFLVGCWWGMASLIVFAGRWYFWNLFQAAIGCRRAAVIDSQSVWIARLFLLSLVALVAALNTLYDLPLDMSVLWVLGLTAMFLVLCRLVAAMGIPWIPLTAMGPLGMLSSFMGVSGMGARVFSQLDTYQTFLIPVNGLSLMPFAPAVANAAHVENKLTGRNPSMKVIVPFLLVMAAVSVVFVLWLGYSYEGKADDAIAPGVWREAPMLQGFIRKAVDDPDKMREAMTRRLSWRERWGNIQMPEEFPIMCGVGLLLVLATGYLQIRLPRFPFHPLPLVLLGTWIMSRYWWSFLIGWAIKRAVLKIGGYRLFDQLRPLFTGIIVGLTATLVIWVIVHTIVYQVKDSPSTQDWMPFLTSIFSAG